MASWFDYSDREAGYLPGEIYRSTGLAGKMMSGTKGWKFQPNDGGSAFGKFLALSKNPDALAQGVMQMPGMKEMNQMATMLGGY